MPTPIDAIAPSNLALDQVVSYWATHKPDQVGLECMAGGHLVAFTWRELESYIEGATQDLVTKVNIGAIVGIVCDDSVEFHILINALWRYGSAVLLLDRTWGIAIVEDLLRLVDCRLVFSNNWNVNLGTSKLRQLDYPSRRAHAPVERGAVDRLDDIAIYATTSGTTDNPKCVAISHRRIRFAYRMCLTVHDFSRIKCAACLFQINSLGVLGVCFLLPRETGAATRAFPAFSIANISKTWSSLLCSSVDFVYLVPPLVRLLNAMPSPAIQERRILAFCASAPVRLEELLKFEAKYPATIFNAYGLTELTFAVFFGCRDGQGLASESIGYAVGVHAKIVDESGETEVDHGCGELHLKGSMLTEGYVHNPLATEQTWYGDWFKTGDLAERDAEGRFFIRGRKKDVVLRGGFTYYLHELEHYLRRAPNVLDACAFKGRELPSGDELCVVAQVDRATNSIDLLMWIKEQMGESKMPNVLLVSEKDLPRNSNGKVLRNVLAKQFLAGHLK